MDQSASTVTNTVAARLISRPSTLRAFIEETEYREIAIPYTMSTQPDSANQLITTNWTKQLRERPGACYCKRRRVRRRAQRRLGPILAFDESETVELHYPDCKFSHSTDGGHTRRLGVACTVSLGEVARWAIAYTFSTSCGAGGYSIGPSFTCHPTIDGATAPAFRVIEKLGFSLLCLEGNVKAQTEMISQCGKQILRLFQSRRAHPLDVNAHNMTLMHALTNVSMRTHFCNLHLAEPSFKDYFIRSYCMKSSMASGFTDLLGMLLDSGVPGGSYDIEGA